MARDSMEELRKESPSRASAHGEKTSFARKGVGKESQHKQVK